MITRFHYQILVYFNNLILDSDDRPTTDFLLDSHSPIVHSNMTNSEIKIVEPRSLLDSDADLLDSVGFLFCIFKLLATGKLIREPCDTKQYQLSSGIILDDVKFDPTTTRALFCVGILPDNDELKYLRFDSNTTNS